jgi:hypothetical protein
MTQPLNFKKARKYLDDGRCGLEYITTNDILNILNALESAPEEDKCTCGVTAPVLASEDKTGFNYLQTENSVLRKKIAELEEWKRKVTEEAKELGFYTGTRPSVIDKFIHKLARGEI